MDPFHYFAAAAGPSNGYTMPTDAPIGNGWSPGRDQMRRYLRTLRARLRRDRIYRGDMLERAIARLDAEFARDWLPDHPPTELRPRPPLPPTEERPSVRRRITPTRVVVDLTCDEVIE